MSLHSINYKLSELITHLKDSKKIDSCFELYDNNEIINIYITEFNGKKINLDEKINMIYNKYNKPIYKTQKGYKSDKLDNLFHNFYKFLVYPTDEYKERIKAYIKDKKIEIVDEKFNLEYDNPKRDYDSMEIKFIKLLEMLNEAIKKSPNGSLNIAHKEIMKILI